MLTVGASRALGRLPATLAVVLPTARVSRPGLVALTAALGSVPSVLTLVVGGSSYLAQLILLGLVTGASVGWAVDDPSAELLASTATGSSIRTVIRVGASALVAGAAPALVLMGLAIGPGLPRGLGDRWPEAAAAAAAALAVGLIAARRGEQAAGAVAVICGVTGPAFVAALSIKLHFLPAFTGGTHHARWWLVALLGLAVALYAGRDPARR